MQGKGRQSEDESHGQPGEQDRSSCGCGSSNKSDQTSRRGEKQPESLSSTEKSKSAEGQWPSSTAGKLEFKIKSDPAHLRELRRRIEQFSLDAGMPRESCDAIGLAFNEALANVMRHAYRGAKDQPIEVTVQRGDPASEVREVTLTIRDWGEPFEPASGFPCERAELRPGGLGILCIRTLMNDVQYERLSDGTRLRMTKRPVHGP